MFSAGTGWGSGCVAPGDCGHLSGGGCAKQSQGLPYSGDAVLGGAGLHRPHLLRARVLRAHAHGRLVPRNRTSHCGGAHFQLQPLGFIRPCVLSQETVPRACEIPTWLALFMRGPSSQVDNWTRCVPHLPIKRASDSSLKFFSYHSRITAWFIDAVKWHSVIVQIDSTQGVCSE